MERVTFFGESERIYDALRLKVLEKFDKCIASVEFCFETALFNATLGKNIVESDDGSQSMSDNFLNTNHGVVFKLNVHLGVVLIGHVEQMSVIRKNLSFGLSNFEKGTLAVEEIRPAQTYPYLQYHSRGRR